MTFAAPAAFGEAAREKVVIAQFGKEKFLLYLPLYVAMEEGLFEKQGLDVQLQFAGNDDQIFATVISGAATFGVGDPVFAAISREKGGPGRIVAMMVTRIGLSGYTNKRDIPDIPLAGAVPCSFHYGCSQGSYDGDYRAARDHTA